VESCIPHEQRKDGASSNFLSAGEVGRSTTAGEKKEFRLRCSENARSVARDKRGGGGGEKNCRKREFSRKEKDGLFGGREDSPRSKRRKSSQTHFEGRGSVRYVGHAGEGRALARKEFKLCRSQRKKR